MNNTAKVGVAVASGYLMGRSKKAKLAFALGTWMMGKRLSLDARKLAREGLSALASSPDVSRLADEVRGELLGAGRTVAMSMFTGQVEKLADTLHQRTTALSGDGAQQPSEQDGEPQEEEEEGEEPRGEEGAKPRAKKREQGEDGEPRPRKRPAEPQGAPRRHRSVSRAARRPSTQEGERPARAGSGRRPAASEESPPRRSRSSAQMRQTTAKAARSRS